MDSARKHAAFSRSKGGFWMKNRIFAAIAAAAMLCCTLISPASAAETYQMGDVNMDGVVDAYDYLELKRAVLGSFDMPEERNALADVNEDGVVDAYDYLELKRAVLGTYELPEVWIAIEVADGN